MQTLWTETCFVGADFVRNIPLAGWLSTTLQTVYVSRGKAGQAAIETIENRQKETEDERSFPPVTIFAEGTTQNNEYLIPFKKGAFSSLRSIIPIIIRYDVDENEVCPFVETCEDWMMTTLMGCTFALTKISVTFLPMI